MKGKGKGPGQQQSPAWGSPNPGKGKGKGPKGSWNPGKGAWGKGAYGLSTEWGEDNSGYEYGNEDYALFSMLENCAHEPTDTWRFPHPGKTCKLTLVSIYGAQGMACEKRILKPCGQRQIRRSGRESGSLRPGSPIGHDDDP